jgi:RNA polymerase sigma-70 factor (ECF subfamily)
LTKEDFRILFDDQFDRLRQYILFRSGNADFSTDIAQDCFLRVWEKKDKIEIRFAKGLLFKMANDLFISRYRKEKMAFEFFRYFKPDESVHSPHEIMEFNQLKATYEKALAGMGENQRSVFLMNRAEGLTYPEIAERLGIGVKAVEKRMNIALNFLKKSINRNE